MTRNMQKSARPKAFLRCDAAASAVEFALLAPLLILLMMGMAGYGIYFGAAHSIQQITADAARNAIAGLTEAERMEIATDYIADNAGGYPFINPAKMTIVARDSATVANQFVVRVSYDGSDLPIWHLFQQLIMPNTTITRQSTVRLGGI